MDNRKTATTGRALHNGFLADALAQDELGTWALDAETLDFLERRIKSERPRDASWSSERVQHGLSGALRDGGGADVGQPLRVLH